VFNLFKLRMNSKELRTEKNLVTIKLIERDIQSTASLEIKDMQKICG